MQPTVEPGGEGLGEVVDVVATLGVVEAFDGGDEVFGSDGGESTPPKCLQPVLSS